MNKSYGIALLAYILLFLSFAPWQFTDISSAIFLLILLLPLPIVLVIFYRKGNRKVFWVTGSLACIGYLALYTGFLFRSKISFLDYLLVDRENLIKMEGNRMIIGEPKSYWEVQSISLYLLFLCLGIIIGIFIQKRVKQS